MKLRRVPVDAKTSDWPRKIAETINALILEIAKMQPFIPVPNSTVNIDVSSTSQRVALGNPDQIRLMNNGTATVWFAMGNSSVTTDATTGTPLPAGAIEVMTVPTNLSGATVYVAAIAAASTGKVYFTPGTGV